MNPMQPRKVGIMEAKACLSNLSDHLISSLKAQLIELTMKTWSSITEDLAQFHRKSGKAIVESCLKYSTKLRRRYSGVNLNGRPGKIQRSSVDCALTIIVGQMMVHNSLNSSMEKLVSTLNKLGVDLIDPKILQTPS